MSDITVHHCTLRVVRHGGWGWGPEPRKLLQSAIKALPELLAHALGELWPDDVGRDFAAPVSIRVPMSLGELLTVANASSDPDSIPNSSAMQALSERIGSAARRAFVTEQTASVTNLETETRPLVNQVVDQIVDQRLYAAKESGSGSAVLNALLTWHKDGVLSLRLAAFSPTALEAWHDRLIQAKSSAPVRESVAQETIERFVDESARTLQSAQGDRAATLRRRLTVLTEVMARLGLRQCAPALLKALDRAFPLAQKDEARAAELEQLRVHDDEAERASTAYASKQPAHETSSAKRAAHERGRSGEANFTRLDHIHASGGGGEQSPLPPHAKGTPELATSEADSASLSHATEQAEPHAASAKQAQPQQVQPQQAKLSQTNFSRATAEDRLTPPTQSPLTEPVPLLSQLQPKHASFQFPRQEGSRRIASALPFLLLAPLSRVGYLKALTATMEAANALESAPLFAAALAYKVLAPPARGWRREPSSIEVASTFASLNQPAPESALVNLARILPNYLSPLDAVLSGALISGHKQEQPLLLLRTDLNAERGFLLLDVEGTFPIQWTASTSELRQVLIQLDSSIVLIPQDSAELELLRWMDEEGFRFVTDAMPTRGERWRSLRRPPHERWWTNEAIMSDSALVRTARVMRDATEEAAALWQALTVARPSVPLADKARLDCHLAMAASMALGTIAWELWREREPTTPLLALERFYDLEARVDFSRDVVSVHLPLGKRFNDLREHALIDDVNDVPWFDGRTLTFKSG